MEENWKGITGGDRGDGEETKQNKEKSRRKKKSNRCGGGVGGTNQKKGGEAPLKGGRIREGEGEGGRAATEKKGVSQPL